MFLQAILKQSEEAAKLADAASSAVAKVRGLRSGDRVFTPLVVAAEFSQGNAPSAVLVFNVPADADFWAYRLLLYPYCKVVDPVNGTPDEVVFRSTSFTGESATPGINDPATQYSDFGTLVDCTFALIYDGKELQNIDTPVSAAYCSNMLKWYENVSLGGSGDTPWAAASQNPSGLVFDIPMFIPRSKNLSLRITPTFLGIRSITDQIAGPVDITRQHRYKIIAVLEGEKKVSAFR